jgi:zinc protease
MRKPARVLTALVAAALLLCTRAHAQTSGGPGDAGIYTTHLANGLQVVVVEDHAAPVVQESIWYHFGSLDETPGKTGLAHALEHMNFRGTNSISAGGLDDIVARLGAQMNAETTYDYTMFYFVMPADKVDVAMQIDADRMSRLALRQADWNVERGAVLNELDGDESSPFFNLLARVRAAAYPGQSEGRVPIGVRSDVAGATAADIARYYHEWYAPNNATLVITGDVDHAAIFAKAQRYFGSIPSKVLPKRDGPPPKPIDHTVSVESDLPFPFEIVDLAYAVPGDTEAGEPAINTLEELLTNQLSPFYRALVQSNVALTIEAQEDTQLKGGLFNVFIVLNPGHTSDEAQAIFQSTMDAVLKNGFDPAFVESAKRLTIAERLYDGDSVDGMGGLAGYTYGIVGEKVADEDARLAALTPGSILDVTRRYLARPTVVGHLRTHTQPRPGAGDKSNAAISDDFSKRVPNGPIVVPAGIRAEVQTPTTARSSLRPTAFTLPNGIHVLVQEKHDRSTFYLAGEIAQSSAFTPQGKEGISRLASSVADYGSDNYPFVQRRHAIDSLGAVVQNGASFEARGVARDFDTIVGILADGEMHPSFAEPWFSLERDQFANSLQSEETISGNVIDRAYATLISDIDDPSLRRPSTHSVVSITRDDLLAYTRAYWRPDLTTIAVVGDVTPQQVRDALEHAFGSWKASGATPSVRAEAYPAPRGGHDYVETEASQVYIRLGQAAISRANPDYGAFLVLNQILGAGGAFESRLWQEMRQKRGLVYGVSSELNAGPDRGDFRIELNTSPERVAEAVAFVRSELKKLQTQPVTANELAVAKLRLVSDALLSEGSTEGQVEQLLDIGANRLPLDYYRTLNDRFAGITAADVQRVAKKYLAPNELIQIYAGPSGDWSDRAL